MDHTRRTTGATQTTRASLPTPTTLSGIDEVASCHGSCEGRVNNEYVYPIREDGITCYPLNGERHPHNLQPMDKTTDSDNMQSILTLYCTVCLIQTDRRGRIYIGTEPERMARYTITAKEQNAKFSDEQADLGPIEKRIAHYVSTKCGYCGVESHRILECDVLERDKERERQS